MRLPAGQFKSYRREESLGSNYGQSHRTSEIYFCGESGRIVVGRLATTAPAGMPI